MVTMSMRQMPYRRRQKTMGDHEKFFERVTKTLHYGKYPRTDRTSLPVTEIAAELFSRARSKLSLDLLDVEEAARLTRSASVSPCSVVLALLYLDRLNASNPKYLAKVPPSQLFLISLMVGAKFLQDDGQEDEVNTCEWATSGKLTIQDINRAEKEFLDAIDWEVYVSEEQFWKRLEGIERLVSFREGSRHGWFSYTDVDLLLKSSHCAIVLGHFVNVILVCAVSYAATVMAVIGSTILISRMTGLAPNASSISRSVPQDCCVSEPIFHSRLNTTENSTDTIENTQNWDCDTLDAFNSTEDCHGDDVFHMVVGSMPTWSEFGSLRSWWLDLNQGKANMMWSDMMMQFIKADSVPNIIPSVVSF